MASRLTVNTVAHPAQSRSAQFSPPSPARGEGFFAPRSAEYVSNYRPSMNCRSRGAHFAQSRPEAVWP